MTSHVNTFSRYLPVNTEALLWEIYCNDAGYAQVPPGANYPMEPEKHPRAYAANVVTGRILREYQVVYITSGKGWFVNDLSGKHNIKAGDIFMLFPGVKHSYCPLADTGWQEYWVGFSGEHADRLFKNGLFNLEKPVHHMGLNQEIMVDFEQIIRFCRQQPPGFQVRLGAMVLQLLAHIHTSKLSSQTTQKDSELVQMARAVMQLHIDEGIEINQIAKELGVGYTYLLGIFRQYTGLTPYKYFLQLRIHRAKDLLENPSLSIKEVSAKMNFENQYYFSRIFKRKTGCAPSQWRALTCNRPWTEEKEGAD